jgi:hypothetical protein
MKPKGSRDKNDLISGPKRVILIDNNNFIEKEQK